MKMALGNYHTREKQRRAESRHARARAHSRTRVHARTANGKQMEIHLAAAADEFAETNKREIDGRKNTAYSHLRRTVASRRPTGRATLCDIRPSVYSFVRLSVRPFFHSCVRPSIRPYIGRCLPRDVFVSKNGTRILAHLTSVASRLRKKYSVTTIYIAR